MTGRYTVTLIVNAGQFVRSRCKNLIAPLLPPSLDGCAPPTNSYSSASSATVTLLSVDIKCNCDCVYAVAGTSRVQLQAAR